MALFPSRRARAPIALLGLVSALALSACGSAGSSDAAASSGGGDSLTVQLSWYSNAQNGGWTTAETEGYLADAGFSDVTITAGGPNVSGIQLLAAGRADIAVTTAESYLQALDQGLPVIAVYNEFDVAPTGVLVKASTGYDSFEDLAGKSWAVAPASLGWQWVQKSLGIEFTTQNFNGSYAAFFAEDDGVTQGYPTNTVYEGRKQGIDLNYFGYNKAGFNPYGQILVVNTDWAADHGDELTRALGALDKGWTSYLTDTDAATRANEAMLAQNTELTADTNWFTWDGQRSFVIGDRGGQQMGAMADDRWDTLVDQMQQMDALSADFAVDSYYTNEYLSDDVMPTLEELPDAPAGSYEGDAPTATP